MNEEKSLLYQYADATSSEELVGSQEQPRVSYQRRKGSFVHILFLYLCIGTLLAGLIISINSKPTDPFLQIYSPVNSVIEYEVNTMEGAFPYEPITSVYIGNSNETDKAWEDLYQAGVTILPTDEANKLPQWTEAIPGHPDQHIVILSVFHEIHCLNYIRKSLYPETYGAIFRPDGTRDEHTLHHLNHCVNLLRQVLMCYADTSVGYFRDGPNGFLPQPTIQRVCRKFENVRNWAEQHRAGMKCQETGYSDCH